MDRDEVAADLALAFDLLFFEKGDKSTSKEILVGWESAKSWAKGFEKFSPSIGI